MGIPRRSVWRASALLACACLLAVGCTARQSHEQYEERLSQALKARTSVTAQLDAGQLTTPQKYEAAAQRVTIALDELDADPPPRDVEAAHDSMVAGLEGLAALLDRLGRCEALGQASEQDRRACRQAIGQGVYDAIRNDFSEANTIYLEEGFSLPGLGDGDEVGDSLGEDPEGGDEL